MISPQLHTDSPPSCPPGSPIGSFNVSLEQQTLAGPHEGRLVVALGDNMGGDMGADMASRRTTDAVLNGLWHCLLGSVAAGLAVSVVLGVVVLVIGQIG